MKKSLLLYSVLVLIVWSVQAQTDTTINTNSIANTPAKSGLSYEALTQFFQANVSAGSTQGYNFKATLFGIKSLFSTKDLNASSIYSENRSERNLEISLGLHKGANNNLSLLLGGIKYAFINNRNKSDINFASAENGRLSEDLHVIARARNDARAIYQFEIDHFKDGADRVRKNNELDAAEERFKRSQEIKEYPQRLIDLYNENLKKAGKDPNDFYQSIQDVYDRIAKQIEKKALLTISLNPGYDWSNSRLDTSFLHLQYLKGFGNFKKPWNFDIQGTALLQHDTTHTKKDLSRSILTTSVGINKILVADSKLNPLVELEAALEESFITNGAYPMEDKHQPKFVTIIRVHITKEISLPLTLKYDLKKPNLFGFFRLQWNLEGGKKS